MSQMGRAPVLALDIQTLDKPSMHNGTTQSSTDRFGVVTAANGRQAASALP
jgi:hypothetical protein